MRRKKHDTQKDTSEIPASHLEAVLLRCGFCGVVVCAVEIKMKENSVDIASWHLTSVSWIYIELHIFIYTDIYGDKRKVARLAFRLIYQRQHL